MSLSTLISKLLEWAGILFETNPILFLILVFAACLFVWGLFQRGGRATTLRGVDFPRVCADWANLIDSSDSPGAVPSEIRADPAVTAFATSTPPVTSTSVKSHWDTQASKVVEVMDYTNPDTRDSALSLIDKDHGGKYNIAQICDMWEKIYKRWTYVNDPKGTEYYSPASRTVRLGVKGDCDDLAILMASSIQAIGSVSRIILAFEY